MSDDVKYQVIVRMLILLLLAAAVLAGIMLVWTSIFRKKSRQSSSMLAEISAAKEELEKIDRIKTNFINSVTHEIRTPLNIINGYIDLLIEQGDNYDESEKQEFIKAINDNTAKLSSLFDDLLDLSSITEETYSINATRFEIDEMLKQASIKAKPKTGIVMSTVDKLEPGTTIVSDQLIVQKILGILIDNACKFTNDGHITIGCEQGADNQHIRFFVENTGACIPAEKSEEIFRKFVKLDEWSDGSGIGLYVARRMGRLIDGALALDTTYKEGARFEFELPVNND